MATVSVTMSGPLLATLLYEHANSKGDQEGFLLGEVASHITDTISDSQLHGEKEETCLKICSIIPCELFTFYDKRCSLLIDKLDHILQDKHKEVVGWYKFRRNSTLQVSMREQLLHQRLAQALSKGYCQYFLLGLFTGITSPNDSTHSMDHVFLRSADIAFKQYMAVPLRVVNLGEPGHSEYRMFPGAAASIHQGAFSEVLGSISPSKVSVSAVQQVQELHQALQRKLKKLQESVATSEEIVATFSYDVDTLREKYLSLSSNLEKSIKEQ